MKNFLHIRLSVLSLALLLACPVLADTPIKITYYAPFVSFATEEGDAVVGVNRNENTTFELHLKRTRSVDYYSINDESVTLNISQARCMRIALTRALSRLDSLDAAQKGSPK